MKLDTPVPRASKVFLEIRVDADDLPGTSALSDFTVEIAVTDTQQPSSGLVAGDWKTAAWQSGGSTLSAVAEILIGPGEAIELSKARHWAWVRVTTTPTGQEVPVVGPFEFDTI